MSWPCQLPASSSPSRLGTFTLWQSLSPTVPPLDDFFFRLGVWNISMMSRFLSVTLTSKVVVQVQSNRQVTKKVAFLLSVLLDAMEA